MKILVDITSKIKIMPMEVVEDQPKSDFERHITKNTHLHYKLYILKLKKVH